MSFLTALAIAILGLTALIHLVWAFGLWWPISDEPRLARTVVGTPGVERMPGRALTLAVVGLLGLGILWIMMLAGWLTLPLPDWTVTTGGAIMAAIMVLRGAGTYVASFFGVTQTPEFTRLDRIWFAPMILFIGLVTLAHLLI